MSTRETRNLFDLPSQTLDPSFLEQQQLQRLIKERQNKLFLLNGRLNDSQTWSPASNLPAEVSRVYGAQETSRKLHDFFYQKSEAKTSTPLVDLLMAHRTREEHLRRDHVANKLVQLNKTRAELLEKHRETRKVRRADGERPLSPPYELHNAPKLLRDNWEQMRKRPAANEAQFQAQFPEPVEEFVKHTKRVLPLIGTHYLKTKHRIEREQYNLNKPYRQELSISSYEPWRLDGYHLCRLIVEEEVERFLNSVFHVVPKGVDTQTAQQIHSNEQHQLSIEQRAMNKNLMAQLITEELILEVTVEASREAVLEFDYIMRLVVNMSDQLCMRQAEFKAIGLKNGRSDEDPLSIMVRKNFYRNQRNRDLQRRNVWSHQQQLEIQQLKDNEIHKLIDDVTIQNINFFHIQPLHAKNLEPQKRDMSWQLTNKIALKNFMALELSYWSRFEFVSKTTQTSTMTKGICSFSVSFNQVFIAIGTFRGDIMIFDCSTPTALLVKTALNTADENPVVHLTWSLDNGQLLSVNANGLVRMWAVFYDGINEIGNERFGVFELDKNPRMQLIEIMALNKDSGDFRFTFGPLSKSRNAVDARWQPIFALFFPSFSILGSQYTLCVGMNNHDVLKIDAESLVAKFGKQNLSSTQIAPIEATPAPRLTHPQMKRRDSPNHKLSSNELPCDLFRAHSHPIIHLCFLENTRDMLSIDEKGNMFKWKYHPTFLDDGFVLLPAAKFKLEFMVENYLRVDGVEPIVRFAQPVVPVAAVRKRGQKAAERVIVESYDTKMTRLKAEHEFLNNGFQDSWKKFEDAKSNEIKRIYKPMNEQITESGAMFHEVTRDKRTGELRLYQTMLYKPYKIYAELFLGCVTNHSNTEVICLILYPPDDLYPMEAKIDVITVDLNTMKALNRRINIFLTVQQYKAIINQGFVSFDVSQPISITNVQYLIININGSLLIYSLLTGQQVGKILPSRSKESRLFNGLLVENVSSANRVNAQSRIKFIDSRAKNAVHICTFKLQEMSFQTLTLQDANSVVRRNELIFARTALDKSNQICYPHDFRQTRNAMQNLLSTGHTEAEMKLLVLEVMDAALQSILGQFTPEESKTNEESDRRNAYAILGRKKLNSLE